MYILKSKLCASCCARPFRGYKDEMIMSLPLKVSHEMQTSFFKNSGIIAKKIRAYIKIMGEISASGIREGLTREVRVVT